MRREFAVALKAFFIPTRERIFEIRDTDVCKPLARQRDDPFGFRADRTFGKEDSGMWLGEPNHVSKGAETILAGQAIERIGRDDDICAVIGQRIEMRNIGMNADGSIVVQAFKTAAQSIAIKINPDVARCLKHPAMLERCAADIKPDIAMDGAQRSDESFV